MPCESEALIFVRRVRQAGAVAAVGHPENQHDALARRRTVGGALPGFAELIDDRLVKGRKNEINAGRRTGQASHALGFGIRSRRARQNVQ